MTVAVMGRYRCNMTIVRLYFGSATLLFIKMLIVEYKYVTQSKYISKFEIKPFSSPEAAFFWVSTKNRDLVAQSNNGTEVRD